MIAVYKRELGAYFHSMTGYICCAFLVCCVGIYFMAANLFSGYPSFAYALNSSLFIFVLTTPLLTMRSMAEDRRNKTDQLLLTSPLSVGKMVLGKYAAMLTVLAIPCVLFCFCPLIIKLNGTATLASDYASILVFFLLGSVCIAVGLLISSLTESQIIAALGTFGALLLGLLWDGLVSYIPDSAAFSFMGLVVLTLLLALLLNGLTGNWVLSGGVAIVGVAAELVVFLVKRTAYEKLLGNLLGAFSLTTPFDNFATNQVFDLAGLILYLSLDALFLFITVQLVQRRRYC